MWSRFKLLRTGIDPHSDENTYTSFWIMPNFVALQSGIPGRISKGFANENHFTPSAWRRALARGRNSPRVPTWMHITLPATTASASSLRTSDRPLAPTTQSTTTIMKNAVGTQQTHSLSTFTTPLGRSRLPNTTA